MLFLFDSYSREKTHDGLTRTRHTSTLIYTIDTSIFFLLYTDAIHLSHLMFECTMPAINLSRNEKIGLSRFFVC